MMLHQDASSHEWVAGRTWDLVVTMDDATKVAYYPEENKSQLIEKGYIVDRSGHSRGSTLDLTLARATDSSELDMGTPYDYFDTRSNTADPRISEQQMANRLLLKNLMEKRGFVNYDKEWWHSLLSHKLCLIRELGPPSFGIMRLTKTRMNKGDPSSWRTIAQSSLSCSSWRRDMNSRRWPGASTRDAVCAA